MTAERCVTARELAGLMGVSLSTVRRMAAAGMLSETWGLARTRWFLPSQAMAWAHARRRIMDPDNHARPVTATPGRASTLR